MLFKNIRRMIAIFVAITSVFVSTLAYSSSQEKVLQNSFSENDILAAVARHVKSEHKELEKDLNKIQCLKLNDKFRLLLLTL